MIILATLSQAQTLQTVEPYAPPKHHQETFTYPDGSTATVWVVKTIPGVKYTFQTSQDLNSWTEIDSLYGMGHEIVIPMVYSQAPEPSSTPPTPTVKKLLTPFLMRPSTTGGIVLTWKSLDSIEGASFSDRPFRTVHLQNLTLATEWEEQIMYSRTFGKFYFLVNHPTIAQTPPATNSVLPENSLDAEFLAAFETALPQMNAEVATSTAAMRNAPEAPPTNTDRKFWRAIADWGIDTDSDGSADWAEFQMQLQSSGGGSNAAIADPTSSDSNNDGIADGMQLNSDNDSIPDANDASSHDPLINWQKTLPTRFALFSLPPGTTSEGIVNLPINVNEKGMVLYSEGVFYGNQYHQLPKNSEHVGVRAKFINDAGRILGGASYAKGNDSMGGSRALFWSSPTTLPSVIGTEEFAPISPFPWGFQVSFPGQHLANDGTFIGLTYENTTDEHGNPTRTMRGLKVWQIDDEGDVSMLGDAGPYDYCESQSSMWGTNAAGAVEILFGGLNNNIGSGNHTNLARVGSHNQAVLHGGTAAARFFKNGEWAVSNTFDRIDGISDTGLVIGSEGRANLNGLGNFALNFWYNGRFYSTERMMPDAPTVFSNALNSFNLGMSKKGHTLLGTINSANDYDQIALAFPCAAEDDVEYTGLDDFSITSSEPDPAYANKIWIMVPTGGGTANSVKLQIPASSENPITISAPSLTNSTTLTGLNQTVTLMGNRATSGDENLVIKSGDAASLSSPIGLKYMKRRDIKITITPVAWKDPHGIKPAVRPVLSPTQAEAAEYLNEVFEKQINANCLVTVRPEVELIYSVANYPSMNVGTDALPPVTGNYSLDIVAGSTNPELSAFDAIGDPSADVNVYVIGASSIAAWTYSPQAEKWGPIIALGYADRPRRSAWVNASFLGISVSSSSPLSIKKQNVLHTIAHEIGHIFIGYGHPNEGAGPAPLPGSDHAQRLMFTKQIGNQFPRRFVKGEWDAADLWLEARKAGQN